MTLEPWEIQRFVADMAGMLGPGQSTGKAHVLVEVSRQLERTALAWELGTEEDNRR